MKHRKEAITINHLNNLLLIEVNHLSAVVYKQTRFLFAHACCLYFAFIVVNIKYKL